MRACSRRPHTTGRMVLFVVWARASAGMEIFAMWISTEEEWEQYTTKRVR